MRTLALIALVSMVAAVGGVSYIFLAQKPAGTVETRVSREIGLIAGELRLDGPYGFGFDGGKLTSPGPTITVKAGQVVRVLLRNVGQLPHNFAVTDLLVEGAPSIWNSNIGSGASPVGANQTGYVTFRVETPGEYYYICQVPGHASLFKMYGRFVVEG